MEEAVRGFILQPTYRLERGRAVVHLWGRLESGETFLVRDGRAVPHFFVRAADADRARRLGARPLAPTGRVTFGGAPVVRVEVGAPPDTPALRERLRGAGILCYEADVRFAMRYLIDRGIRGSLALRGSSRPGRGVARVFEEPEVEPADWTPELSVLSFDLETDPKASRILSVALHGCGAGEVILLAPPGLPVPEGALPAADEAELLRHFSRRVRELDPDVLTGWNVADFDFPVLVRRAAKLGVALALGRAPGRIRRLEGRGWRQATQIVIPGRLVLDGLHLLRGSFIRMEDYSLDAVAREVVGEGKIITGRDRAGEILRAFQHDRKRLVEYNLKDARLVSEILEKLQLVELAVERSRLTGLPPDRVSSSVAAFDFLYLSALHRRGVVAPSVRREPDPGPGTGGGHVLEPRVGLYRNVLLFDVRSLYPSLIRTFQIDPLGHVPQPSPGDDLIRAPNGAAFRREPGILSELLDELFPRRAAADRAGDRVTSYAVKILMNSFFGVLGTPVCRFFNPEVANAITSLGRELLLWSRDHVEGLGPKVLYGDTDSLFVESGEEDAERARALGETLRDELNQALAAHVRERWGVESRLEVEMEKLYLRFFLPAVRHGEAGARKRYAGLVERPGREPRVELTGLEAVRRDWTELARRAQRELFARLFADRPVEEYLRRLVEELRSGELDDLLVYRKTLRKPPEAYTATTPPHVAAARKSSRRRRRITYVMTAGGPEPAGERRSPFDYQHYVEKQLRPVADPILGLLGLDFAKVIGDDRQIDLF